MSHTQRVAERSGRPESFTDTVARLALAQKPARGAPAYSRYVNRRAGRYLAAAAYRIGLTPNTVTAISAAFTFTAIALLALVHPSWEEAVIVCAALVIGYAFDAADGQLARLRGGGSMAGEWLDHMVDATKISSLHLAVLVGAYRFTDLGRAWLVVPLAFSVVSAVTFFGMILNEQLKRARGLEGRPTAERANASLLRSVAVAPADYGVLCISFLLLGSVGAFSVVYGLLFVGCAGYLLLAVVKWFGDMTALDEPDAASMSPVLAVNSGRQ